MKSGGRSDEMSVGQTISADAQRQAEVARRALPVDHRIKEYNAYAETAICQPDKAGGLEWTKDVYVVLHRDETKITAQTEAAIVQALRDIEGDDFGECRHATFLRLTPNAAKALEAMEERNDKKQAVAEEQARQKREKFEREHRIEPRGSRI